MSIVTCCEFILNGENLPQNFDNCDNSIKYKSLKSVKILYLNVQGLIAKIDQIKCLLVTLRPDICCSSETNLKSKHSDTEIIIYNYKHYRQDNNNCKIGRLITYIRIEANFIVNIKEINNNNDVSFEFIKLEIFQKLT